MGNRVSSSVSRASRRCDASTNLGFGRGAAAAGSSPSSQTLGAERRLSPAVGDELKLQAAALGRPKSRVAGGRGQNRLRTRPRRRTPVQVPQRECGLFFFPARGRGHGSSRSPRVRLDHGGPGLPGGALRIRRDRRERPRGGVPRGPREPGLAHHPGLGQTIPGQRRPGSRGRGGDAGQLGDATPTA